MGPFGKKENKVKYLFTEERQSFPVTEFISSPDESLNIPSFILETAWPRVVYIYYPNHAEYQYFNNDFVQIARRIRSESDILVLFYAISCAAHNPMCSNTDLVQTPNRPILKAYESGSSKGKEILIESPISTIESANIILHQLCDALSIGDSIRDFHANENQQLHDLRGDYDTNQQVEQKQNMVKGIEITTSEKMLQDTFVDAQKAFLLTLEFNVYDDLKDGSDDSKKYFLTKRKADILLDFLDLCYWTLPPYWKIQEIILALRTDFTSVMKDKDYLQSVLSSSYDLRQERWSESCRLSDDGNERINGVDMASYSCAVWKLLYIISFGATESYSHVMGDTIRARPTYVAWVIRDFIEEFMPNAQERQGRSLRWCKGCKETLISSYDLCEEEMICFINDISIDHVTRESYKPISKWLWGVEKATMTRQLQKNTSNMNIFVYDNVKKDYWPSNLKIVRVSVLKKFKRKLPKSKKSSDDTQTQSELVNFTIIAFIFVCILLSRRVRRIRSKEQ